MRRESVDLAAHRTGLVEERHMEQTAVLHTHLRIDLVEVEAAHTAVGVVVGVRRKVAGRMVVVDAAAVAAEDRILAVGMDYAKADRTAVVDIAVVGDIALVEDNFVAAEGILDILVEGAGDPAEDIDIALVEAAVGDVLLWHR